MEQKLRLNEFKDIYKAWKKGIPIWDHLLLGVLFWLEEKYIAVKASSAVDKALEEVVLPPLPDCVTPVYSETPGEGSLGVSELRLTAPWYDGGVEPAETATEASRDL